MRYLKTTILWDSKFYTEGKQYDLPDALIETLGSNIDQIAPTAADLGRTYQPSPRYIRGVFSDV